MKGCAKKPYRTSSEAASAASHVSRTVARSVSGWTTYRCGECRFDDGQRAWHWGNHRPPARRRRR